MVYIHNALPSPVMIPYPVLKSDKRVAGDPKQQLLAEFSRAINGLHTTLYNLSSADALSVDLFLRVRVEPGQW